MYLFTTVFTLEEPKDFAKWRF